MQTSFACTLLAFYLCYMAHLCQCRHIKPTGSEVNEEPDKADNFVAVLLPTSNEADADQAISDREKEQKHTRQHHLRHRSHHKKRHLLTAKIRKDENPSAFRMPNHLAARHKHHLMLAKPFWPWP